MGAKHKTSPKNPSTTKIASKVALREESCGVPLAADDGTLVDPTMVILKRAPSNGVSANARQQPARRRHWVWLALICIIFGGLILWNHVRAVMLPESLGTTVVSKYIPLPKDSSSSSTTTGSREVEREAEAVSPGRTHENQPVQPAQPLVRTDVLPSSLAPIIPLHASEALQCRESVVGFVINATDGKDECEGLKKAFDKTCGDSVEMPAEDRGVKPDRQADKREIGSKTAEFQKEMHRFGEHQRNKLRPGKGKQFKKWRAKRPHQTTRRLSEKVNYSMPNLQKWKLWLYQTRKIIWDWGKHWFGPQKDFVFAEDEILEAWDDAESLVANDLDGLVHADLTRQWEKERRERRRLQETTADENAPSADNTTVVPSVNKTKPVFNLALPTLKKHASGEVLQDVLMLQQGDKLINETNAAAEEAAVSSKAMSDTAAAVSAVLNDPTSVEARTCCTSILNVYHENCSPDEEEQISDTRLFLIVLVMALCGMVKSLIRHYRILWLPEAAGCIIVGIVSGYVLMFFPHHDISFDGHWFLRIMVPPIIFEAALSIDKRSFNRHVVPILLYAVVGTLAATFFTAEILHRGTHALRGWCTPIPYVEALTFGALISSIDPIAVLSVLSNMGMTDKDTIYVLIFGESLLNDGVAIVLFETLVHFLDERLIIDDQAIAEAAIHFSVIALGSTIVGAAAGYAGTVYFWLFQGCQTPLVEVLMFFCWALLPYYVCDGIGWSGIVSTVATGFVMDIHIVGQRKENHEENDTHSQSKPPPPDSPRDVFSNIFAHPDGHLSAVARSHIGFVTGMIATTMETAIFAYLGLFLFSHRYHWSFLHVIIAIMACCFSRGIMIPLLSFFVNTFTKVQQTAQSVFQVRPNNPEPAGVIIDGKMQFVLWFAGLRGAMSFALVESIPLYDSVSGEGTPLKPELKAMTSACIMFTVFVLGGYTYYVMDSLGMAPGRSARASSDEGDETGEESEDLLEPLRSSISSPEVPTSRRRVRPAT